MMPLQRSPSAAEARAFQVKLIYIHRTKVAHVQQVPHDAHAQDLSCYTPLQSHCLQTMGQDGMRAWGEIA